LLFLPSSCGYHNPYVYNGPELSLYITNWNNRTSELNLDSKIYLSLIKWYQKSGSIKVKREKAGADLILAGEIISINLPSLTYGVNNATTQARVYLTVRYILKNLKTDKIIFEVSRKVLSETYSINADSTVTSDNESKALDKIINDLSEDIYIQTLGKLRRMNVK
jgi:hypothetical protein